MALVPTIKPDDWTGLNRVIRKLASLKLGFGSNPIFAGLTLSGLTASRLIYSNASKILSSVTISSPLVLTTGTLSITGLSTLGTANYLAGVNSGATGWEYKQLAGTSNQVVVTHAANLITLSTPQDIHTGASPTFAGLTLSGFSGLVKATAGVLSAITDNSANWDTAYSHSQIVTGNPHSLDYADIGLSANQVIDWTDATSAFITSLTGHFGGNLDTDGSLTVDGTAAIGSAVSVTKGLGVILSIASSGATAINGVFGLVTQTKYTPTVGNIGNTLGLSFTAAWTPSANLTANSTMPILGGTGANIAATSLAGDTSGYNMTITEMYGFKPSFGLTKGSGATGTVTGTNVYNFEAVKPTLTNGATATNVFGLYVPGLTGTGITNAWGLGINTDSYINANLSIGKNTAPTVALDVVGAGLFSTTLGVTGLITATGGIKIIDGANLEKTTSDLTITTAAQKTLLLSQAVWNDINMSMITAKVPAAHYPTWATFLANLNSYTFAIDDYVDMSTAEILHDYKEGTDIGLHLHIVTNGLNDATARKVKYTIYYSWGDMDEVMSAQGSLTAELTITANLADKTHLFLDMGDITGTNYKIGSLLKMRVIRIAGTGTEPAVDPFVEQAGIHYQIDTIGSRQELVK